MDQHRHNRRQLLGMATAGAGAMALASAFRAGAPAVAAPVRPEPVIEDGIAWYDVTRWGVEGKGWADTVRFYDRLPARAEGKVPPAVWDRSRHSTGMLTRFRTDASAVHVRYALRSPTLAIPHMAATGASGIDLYAQDTDGRDRWLAVVKPTSREIETRLVDGVDPGLRRYTAYLPLHNGVESLQIGVARGASFHGVPPRTDRPIAVYGTSIVHGTSASRPGMAFTGILGRRFGRPVVNLGVAGVARMEPEVGELLAELDPAVFVVDCLPNMTPDLVAERGEAFVRQLRTARPDTPVMMVEDRTYGHAWLVRSARDRHAGSRAAYREAYRNLRTSGVRGLSYLQGEDLLGDDGEATTDGSHPSDLGMVRYADAYGRVLRRVL